MLTQKKLLIIPIVAGIVTAGTWTQRAELWSWYCVRELRQAEVKDREVWVQRLVDLDVAAQPRVLECLASPDPGICQSAAPVLVGWARAWKYDDPRSEKLLAQIVRDFPVYSVPGRNVALEAASAICHGDYPEKLPQATARLAGALLEMGVREPLLRARTLNLAGVLARRVPEGPWMHEIPRLAREGMESADADIRAGAVLLFLHGQLKDEVTLSAKLPTMLRDPAATVRRAALLVLGSNRDQVSEDDLLPLLHDEDPDVVALCEVALRSRGLKENHLWCARCITDARPLTRLEVLEYLSQATDLEPGVWLRRLSMDPMPAVRAAAIRAAADDFGVDFADRLGEMERDDPSPTVRQIAAFYLRAK